MSEPRLVLEHSVEADVPRAFAWKFRTDIANWNDPPARFELDGPFAEGSLGRTILPDQEPVRWRVATVRPEHLFVIELVLDGAIVAFEWRFESLPGDRTRTTQRIVLSGHNAGAYAHQVESGFGPTLEAGMQNIVSAMVAARKLAEQVG